MKVNDNDAVLEGDKVGAFLDEEYYQKQIEQFCPHTLITEKGRRLSNFTILADVRSVVISAKTGKVSRVSLKARDWNGKLVVLVWQAHGAILSSEPGVPVIEVEKIIVAK